MSFIRLYDAVMSLVFADGCDSSSDSGGGGGGWLWLVLGVKFRQRVSRSRAGTASLYGDA